MSRRRSIGKTTEGKRDRDLSFEGLRERLLTRGYSLRSFALKHGYSVATVYNAAHGTRAGKTSTPIAKHLEQFAYES
jgi:lambda repressor-like predicted transcriptional regulator